MSDGEFQLTEPWSAKILVKVVEEIHKFSIWFLRSCRKIKFCNRSQTKISTLLQRFCRSVWFFKIQCNDHCRTLHICRDVLQRSKTYSFFVIDPIRFFRRYWCLSHGVLIDHDWPAMNVPIWSRVSARAVSRKTDVTRLVKNVSYKIFQDFALTWHVSSKIPPAKFISICKILTIFVFMYKFIFSCSR